MNKRKDLCQETDCKTRPSFNVCHFKKPMYCKEHSKPGMIDVKSKRCQEPGCQVRPSYNFEREKLGIYCKEHSKPGMIDVISKRCQEPGCQIRPIYNFEREKLGIYCKEHSKPGMIDVKNKRCQEPGCQVQPSYNFEREKLGIYCKEHSKPGMIDVEHKRCQEPGCNTRAGFGIVGLRPTHCAEHIKPQMINNPRRKCEVNECDNYATFGVKSIPERCDMHKTEGIDHDLVLQRCLVCLDPSVVDEKQLCIGCDKRGHNVRLGRQKQVKAAILKAQLPIYESYDKIAYDTTSCGKERPDFVWDCESYKLILEVDEDQHKTRLCECEQTRMVNVTQGLGMPCLWIRYNPDEFKGQKSSLREYQRLEFLVKTIKSQLLNPPKTKKEYLRVIHLFFDNFKISNNLEINIIPCL